MGTPPGTPPGYRGLDITTEKRGQVSQSARMRPVVPLVDLEFSLLGSRPRDTIRRGG